MLQEDELRLRSYFQNLGLASHDLDGGNYGRADQRLEECPVELRDWPWRIFVAGARQGS
jgi:hypothetical protein